MAKKIKAIKCPQCGSTKASEIRKDYYRCNSCNTEFFLDSDDINIFHNFNFKPQKKLIPIILAIVGFFMLLMLLPLFFNNISSNNHTPIIEEKIIWDIEQTFAFTNDKKEPIMAVIGNRYTEETRFDDDKKIPSIGFYEINTGKEISIVPAPQLKINKALSVNINIKTFANQLIYIIINNHELFTFNPETYELLEFIPESYDFPEFEKGFSNIKFGNYGDGFEIINNVGKEFYYYPIINKVYTETKLHRYIKQFQKEGELITQFQFSSSFFKEFPEEPIQLIQYEKYENLGYPQREPHFEWRKDYGGPGIYTDRSHYQKKFLMKHDKNGANIVSYKDFTPGRTYFSPTVIYNDQKQVLISFKPTLSPDASTSLQLLNADTGDIIWTIVAEEDFKTTSKAISTKDNGFLIIELNKYWSIDSNGKTIHIVKSNDVRNY